MLSKSSLRNLCQSFSHSSDSSGFFLTLQDFWSAQGQGLASYTSKSGKQRSQEGEKEEVRKIVGNEKNYVEKKLWMIKDRLPH